MDLSSVVTGLLGELGKLALNAAINKAAELNSVREQVLAWQNELKLIHAKLEDVESKDKSKTGEEWMKQLRDVADGIHKVIETYQQKIEEDKSQGCCCRIKFKVLKKPLQLNDLSAEIKSITDRLNNLIKYSPQMVIIASNVDPAPLPVTPTYKPTYVDDPEVVGLYSDRNRILKQLLDESILRRTILSIVGVGGLGKTTLAKKVYNSSELKDRFLYRIWLSISQTFNENDILRKILYSIKPEMENKKPPLGDDDLVMEVKSSLSDKRYLIILDDVWTKDLWEVLQEAIPDANNGSRVIITTRDVVVARSADRNIDSYQLRFLTDDESVALLFRTAFQRPDIQPEDYPPPLKDIAQKLTKRCGGLPLALVVLGGILSTEEEHIFPTWNRVYETMNWHDQDGDKCMKTLAKSYKALPNDHIRRCFLYFASFPEDHEISAQQVTRMWVADELIPEPRKGTLEDQAEEYLQELVKRCLVQVTKKNANSYCKYCRMHDLVRDLAIHEAKKENFFTVFSREGDGGNIQQLQLPLPPNRVALQFCTPAADHGIHSTNTRSLLCFGIGKIISIHQEFTQLRVLVFEHVGTFERVSSKNWVVGLVHLRYLGFRHCGQLIFGSISFSGLKSLETLDCTGTQIYHWSNASSLWEIPTLRHAIIKILPLFFGIGVNYSSVDCPLNWDQLKNLQTLKWANFMKDIPKLECNVNLRTLKVACHRSKKEATVEEGWQRLQALLSRAVHLVSLSVYSDTWVPFLSIGTSGLPCHDKIQSLYLRGDWARDVCVLSIEMLPENLTKLKLVDSELEEDPMPVLERLQSLRILRLRRHAYKGRKMICSARGFPSLWKLGLRGLNSLSEWEIKEGAMPVLNHLEIINCRKLHTLPELQNVPSLQELKVTRASTQLHERSKIEDRHKIEQIPSVRITTGQH